MPEQGALAAISHALPEGKELRDWCAVGYLSMMDAPTLFGLFAVTAMLVCYAFESRSHWFVLGFAAACLLGSAYGFLQGAWPFGLVEAVWAGIAAWRWRRRLRSA